MNNALACCSALSSSPQRNVFLPKSTIRGPRRDSVNMDLWLYAQHRLISVVLCHFGKFHKPKSQLPTFSGAASALLLLLLGDSEAVALDPNSAPSGRDVQGLRPNEWKISTKVKVGKPFEYEHQGEVM